MLHIKHTHLSKFEQIKLSFYSKTRIPKEHNWRSRTNNDIWLEIVGQVVVVGRSEPYEKLKSDTQLKERISYCNLIQINDQRNLQNDINKVLLAVGTRYASSDLSKSVKAKALAHNLNFLKQFQDGPKGFLLRLSEFEGPKSDKLRIKFVMRNLMYIKNKGARDFLMELGLVKNAVALDSRIQNILQKFGVEIPENFTSNTKLYDEIEHEVLTKICEPLGISGIEFDRMLYQNYDDIMRVT